MSSLCEQKVKKKVVSEKCLVCGNERDDVSGGVVRVEVGMVSHCYSPPRVMCAISSLFHWEEGEILFFGFLFPDMLIKQAGGRAVLSRFDEKMATGYFVVVVPTAWSFSHSSLPFPPAAVASLLLSSPPLFRKIRRFFL